MPDENKATKRTYLIGPSHSIINKPAWADAIGNDSYGLWASFKVENVEQPMRWISPGRFQMGSPENEKGRLDYERLHQVTLTLGFWLFDTPVRQVLWNAVMEGNPGNFQGDYRPVEQVS